MKTAQYITVDEALDLLQDNTHMVVGLGCGEPQLILSNVHKIADRINRYEISNCLSMMDYEFMNEEYREKFLLNGWFYSKSINQMHKRGNATFRPNHLHYAASKLLYDNHIAVYAGSCSGVDEHGYVSLSTGNTYETKVMEKADMIILETNPNFPRTFGDVQVHISEIDYLIEADYPVPTIPNPEPNEKDMAIGKLIAEHINDGDTIQLGIGGIPNAVAKFLYDKKDLGVHTEMITSEMAKLAKAGVINGSKKTLHKGKIVTTFIMGDQELFDFVDNNPGVMVMNGEYTNDPYVIAQNYHQVSINTTVEIDLTGQCASESIGSTQISGTGGQSDTAIGAQLSEGGRSFIALYSTHNVKNKETGEVTVKSKIVPQLTPGAIVSLQRQEVDYVVTEYGVVNLRGATVRERVSRLISIAHPDFREQLKAEAIKHNIIGASDVF